MEKLELSAEFDFETMDLSLLVDHILKTHHVFVKENIPLLLQYTKKIAEVHGANHPELMKIETIFKGIANDMLGHLGKEEDVLFPNIIIIVNKEKNNSPEKAEPVSWLIQGMETEHEFVGNEMKIIANLSANFTPPPDGCTTYQITFQKLKEFDENLQQHVHLENEILFKRIIEVEKKLNL
ncbi:MAG: hemerythrin domain-containing protein [Bacteroidetes bacterium]|nr:hemerythrin domain-containing protein [Bacteroidota bacterium]